MVHELRDLETKKSVHINLTRETHAALRTITFKRHLSMQEVFEHLAIQIVENHPRMVKFLDDVAERKHQKKMAKMTSTDAESIYKVIAATDPQEDGS